MKKESMPEVHEWTILTLLKWAASYFKSHNIDSPRSTAEILLAHTLEIKRIDLYLRYDQPLTTGELAEFKVLIKRRVKKEPVAYIVGHKEFWSMDFTVSNDVLIPRPDTECLVETTFNLLSKRQKEQDDSESEPMRIFEPGTGSGAVIISLASELTSGAPGGKAGYLFFAADKSPRAVTMAKANAKRNHFEKKIHFFSGDWFGALKGDGWSFDAIVSNPPYVPTRTITQLQPEIYDNEPIMALDGGPDGLDAIKLIVGQAPRFLKKRGGLLLEIGYDQKEKVQHIIERCGAYCDIRFNKDYAGHFRVVQMVKR